MFVHRPTRPRLRFLRLGLPEWCGRLRVAHVAGLRTDYLEDLEGAARALDLVQETDPDVVVITGLISGREDQVVGLLAGLEVPVALAPDRGIAPSLLAALRRSGVGVPPCGRLRLETLTLGMASDPAAAPLLWARGASVVLAGSGGPPLPGRSLWSAQAAHPHTGQLVINRGPVQREVTILDLRQGPLREPVERPWDFAA